MSPGDWIALAAIGGSAATVFWTTRSADQQRRASELGAMRAETAAVMGPVGVLLIELDPDRWIFTAGPGAPARVQEIKARWEPTRLVLAGAAASYPNDEVREKAQRLEVALHRLYVSSCSFGGALPRRDEPFTYEKAKTEHAEAQAVADDLAACLRREWSAPVRRRGTLRLRRPTKTKS